MERFITQVRKTKKLAGFTLLEVMMVVAIIGILSTLAMPSYLRYVDKAKAADVLVHMHSIALAYHDVFATDPEKVADHAALSSPHFGEPPSLFDGMLGVYQGSHGLIYSSQLANHSGFFGYTGHEEFPILFVKAETDEGHRILDAFANVLVERHTFVTPSILMVVLAQPYESVSSIGNLPSNKPSAGASVSVPSQTLTPAVTNPPAVNVPPGNTNSLTGTSKKNTQGTGSQDPANTQGTQNTGAGGVDTGAAGTGSGGTANTGTSSGGSGGGTSLAGSSAGSQLNWPPGWVKHPQNHQGQNHPGQGHH